MRKVEQRKIIELLRTLKEANAEMRRLFSQGETNSVMHVLADCQDVALVIGEYIEGIAGEGTKTVALLEDYCEELYKVSVDIGEGNKVSNIFKRLDKCIMRIENCIRSELRPDRMEIAFFPHKRAMSDALESIWQAALKDPWCDTYIVPIPYYDRLPNGSFGAMHYEGGLYPGDIPITDWREYDVEEHHPDVIFTMYPYDDGNHVTSLHTDYYSDRLKECCDLLVYVPYFVSVDDQVGSTLCRAKGVVNADKVFLQSEAVRLKYIEELHKIEQILNSPDHFGKAEDKYVALGSPKFDAVINAKPEDFTLPDRWRTLIERDDGTKRKVIFYNTTIDAMLHGDEQYLKKLRSVLDFFRGCDDVVLWWRPHPLGEATYQSMRPMLVDEYKGIVADYKNESWGIFDDTADLHRAIALSDAYYGDWSSVVALYKVSRKPVRIQSVESLGFLTEVNYGYSVFAVHKGFLTFTPFQWNALITINMETLEAQYNGQIANRATSNKSFYNCVVEGENKAYFVSSFDKEILEYCYETGEYESRALALKSEYIQQISTNFFTGYLTEQNLFLFPNGYGAIVKYDLINYTTEHILIKDANQLEFQTNIGFVNCCLIGDEIAYITSASTNAVLAFNLCDHKSKVYRLGNQCDTFGYILKHGAYIWIQVRNRPAFIRWDYINEKEVEYTAFPEGFISGDKNFAIKTVFHYQDSLYCFPYQANMAVILDLNTGTIKEIDAFNTELYQNHKRTNTKVLRGFMNGEVIYLFTNDGYFIQYNTLNHQINSRKFVSCLTYESTQKLSEDALQSLLDGRESGINIEPSNDNPSGNAGTDIYNYCRRYIGV
jgi:hypothetical protein